MPKHKITIKLRSFEFNNRILIFKKPLTLMVKSLTSKRDFPPLFSVRYKKLGIDAYAHSIGDLRENIKDNMRFCWENYALCDGKKLTAKACLLKKNLLRSISAKQTLIKWLDAPSPVIINDNRVSIKAQEQEGLR